MQRAIEAAGIPTIIIAALPPVVRQTGTPRAVAPRVPMGANAGEPHNVEMQTGIVKATLEQLVKLDTPGKVVPLPFEYVAKVKRGHPRQDWGESSDLPEMSFLFNWIF